MKPQRIIVNGILAQDGSALIARRSATKKVAPGKYHLPGGHVEFGEQPSDAIVREFLEEFKINVQPGNILQTFSYATNEVHTVGICFLLSLDGDANTITAGGIENDEIQWMPEGELTTYFSADDHNYVVLKNYFEHIRTKKQELPANYET